MMRHGVISLSEARKVADDWTSVDSWRERKKIQNRLNQRARRRRTTDPTKVSSDKHHFQIDRWRISELVTPSIHPKISLNSKPLKLSVCVDEVDYSAIQSQDPKLETLPFLDTSEAVDRYPSGDVGFLTLDCFSAATPDIRPPFTFPVDFPLSADHLLHLIHYNVFRAIKNNKAILSITTSLTKPNIPVPITPCTSNLCDGLTLIHPLDPSLPPALRPTTLQMDCPHPSWMNALPFFPVRDTLISCAGSYDEVDFLKDMIGESFFTPDPNDYPEVYEKDSDFSLINDNDDDWDTDVAARRRGLIIWGEPWDVLNWEATPGFLKKWGWMLGGCEDLIMASNRWRKKRGEEPLASLNIEV